MFTFKFEHCSAVVASDVFCDGFGAIVTRYDENGKKDENCKVFVKLDNEAIKKMPTKDWSAFILHLQKEVEATIKHTAVFHGKNPFETHLETVIDITANCYHGLYERHEDSRMIVNIISGWADEFDRWWWSLSLEEQEEKDYILSIDEFCERKLKEDK